MKKTKKAILGSVAAIAMCSSLMLGTTYALFTSESEVNIAVTSANVTVAAKVDTGSVQTKSLDTDWEVGTDGTYQGDVKVNADGDVEFKNVVTGDGVKFDINVTNTSSIAVKYRTSWECDDAEMLNSLTFKVNNEVCAMGKGMWQNLAVGANPDKLAVEIEMGDVADATVQHSFTLTFLVEAVQGNGNVGWMGDIADEAELSSITDEETKTVSVSTPAQMAAVANMVNTTEQSYEGYTVKLMNDIDLGNREWTPIGNLQVTAEEGVVGGSTATSGIFKGAFDGQNHTIYNLHITGNKNNVGFIGATVLGPDAETIKDINFVNATVSGNQGVGVLAGQTNGGEYQRPANLMTDSIVNVTVTNATVTGVKYVGGVVGYSQTDLTDVKVTKSNVTSVENAGLVVGDLYALFSIDNATVVGGTVSGTEKVSAVAGSSHNAQSIANCKVSGVNMVIDAESTDNRIGWISGRAARINIDQHRYDNNVVENCTATKGGEPFEVEIVHIV